MGTVIGCVIGTYLIDIQMPRVSYKICFFFVLAQAVVSFFLSSDVENNPLATGKDNELLKYEAEQRSLYPEKYGNGQEVEAPPLPKRVFFKLLTFWNCINVLPVKKFILF